MTNAHGLLTDRSVLATLTFATYGIILAKRTEGTDEIEEYAIDPKSLTDLFHVAPPVPRPPPPPRMSSDIVLPSTICVLMIGSDKTVIDYREPQMTAIWLEGNDQALHVPLPPMLMSCTINADGRRMNYAIYALKERPTSMDCMLYHAPLVHVFDQGNTCWGTVVIEPETQPNSLEQAWKAFLGSPFSNHGGAGRSKHRTHKKDIRGRLIALDKKKARKYPLHDLVEYRTLRQAYGIPKDK